MRVLVSGAGVAGPALAWHLAEIGAHVTVLEKAPGILNQGQNVDLSGAAITMIKKMGLLDEVLRNNTGEVGARFIADDGKPFAHFPLANRGISPTSPYEILRGDLSTVLYNASRSKANVEYRFGTTISRLISNDETCARVELSTGEVREYDLVVGADGQWSRLRKQCFAPEDVTVVDKDAFITYFTVERQSSDDDWWRIYLARHRRTISLRPDPHGGIRVMASLMPSSDEQRREWQLAARADRDTQERLFKRDFADAGWQAPRLLAAVDRATDFYFQPLQQIRMSRWSSGRVVLLGDAAHAPTPLTGYGTSLALIGAHILAGELEKLGDGEHPRRALDAYESTFHPFVLKIQDIPSWVPAFVHQRTLWGRWLLQLVFSLLAKTFELDWVSKKFGQEDAEANNDGFALPDYPGLQRGSVIST